MKDVKSLLLIIFSSLLFLAAFILLWIWGYQYYVKEKTDNKQKEMARSILPDTTKFDNDSLRYMYSAALKELDGHFDSTRSHVDSLGSSLNQRLLEFYRLRNEIDVLLKNNTSISSTDLAHRKILELQHQVKDLLDKNLDVEYENKKLVAVLEQLKNTMKVNEPVQQKVSFDRPATQGITKPLSEFTISDLRLSAMMTKGDREVETNLAGETEKLFGSCSVINNTRFNAVSELVVVVIQPNGQVLKNSEWESGTFLSQDGRKVYSCKLRFDANHGDVKQVEFSLSADSYQNGNYTLMIYHSGILIGKIQKMLS